MGPLALSLSLFALALGTPAFATPVKTHLARDLITANELKQKITVDSQGITKTWVGDDVCKFKGFYCAENPVTGQQAVASIDFQGYNFGGDQLVLNGFINKLTDLAIFHVNSNRFIGQVPDLSALPQLYELDLSNNKISGQFPSTVLGPKRLTFLDLRFNDFGGPLPQEVFSNYPKIEHLYVNNNRFSGPIPSNVGSSPATYLVFANNQFTGSIPHSIGNARNLQEVLFTSNQLSGPLPKEIGSAKKLVVFNAAYNKLTGGVPEEICQLKKLQVLNLTNNYFSQPLGPKCLALQANGILDVSGNCIKGADNQRAPAEC